MWITLRCDLRPSSTRRLDLRSASDARDTKTAYAVHENARFAGFTKNSWIVCDVHFLRMQIFAIIRVMSRQMIHPDECYAIRGAVYEVYRELGSGFREEVYQQCLEREFAARGIPFDSKKELHIFYKGAPIEKTYVPDFYCYGKIIVEIKAVESLTKEHRSQLMNYLRLTSSKLGLLVNFGAYPKAVVEQWAN